MPIPTRSLNLSPTASENRARDIELALSSNRNLGTVHWHTVEIASSARSAVCCVPAAAPATPLPTPVVRELATPSSKGLVNAVRPLWQGHTVNRSETQILNSCLLSFVSLAYLDLNVWLAISCSTYFFRRRSQVSNLKWWMDDWNVWLTSSLK